MDDLIPSAVRSLQRAAEEVCVNLIAANAAEVDQQAQWPVKSMRALADAGLLGLHVPQRLGGHEQGLLALAVLTETIGKACSSSAICYGMHCVGTAVIAAKATPDQETRYLKPIAEGRHISTLSLSEAGTGAQFYFSETDVQRDGESFRINGTKQFVTSGGFADSYVLSTRTSGTIATAGEFNCLILDRNTHGVSWLGDWNGFGMRGNSSRGLRLSDARVPITNLLGEEGDEIWYVFEVIAPYFLIAMSGTYLGIAQAALDLTIQHVRTRRHDNSGESLAHLPAVQYRLADMWTAVEKSRLLTYHAARLGDLGDSQALLAILASKADVAEMAARVTNEAMTLCGGSAYRENSDLARLLRDARAAHVMAPTTDMLRQWTGRAVLGLPLL